MAIAEVFLGAFMAVLLERLASKELLKFLRPSGIDVHLKKWREELMMIESLLVDAENKQKSDGALREWLSEMEQLAYDLDDLVDKLNTERLQRTSMKTKETSTGPVQSLSTLCTKFSILLSDIGMDSKFTEINDRLEVLVKRVSVLSLVMTVSGRSEKTGQRLQLTSVVKTSEVYGRETEKEDILNKVLGIESEISVIPIVGMGGVGKTTLAQLVYNDDRLKGDCFNLKAWACVSDEFDAVRVTKTILEKVSSGRYDSGDLNMLQEKLKETLSDKRFLVVLDDVWCEDYQTWDLLRQPFLSGKPGSKIIVTTRNKGVAQNMSFNEPYHLDVLSDEAALSLLAQHSLKAKTFDGRPDLMEIGKSIVRKCKNLPLAVKAIGGILRKKDNPKGWEDVLRSDTWKAKEEGGILPALKLSYQYLPPELKRCFAYCALFPKDYEFEKSELENLWMAEGFVQDSEEYLGSRNFDELFSRSFFQQSSADSSHLFVMHDLHNDLAMFVAGGKCLRMEDDAAMENRTGKISEKVRHLSIIPKRYYRFNFDNQFRGLRTFWALPYFPPYNNLFDQLPNLEHLRVLSLAKHWIIELPNSVGELKQLRYLDLTFTPLKFLPESLTTLINLKVLILRCCLSLTKLPANMENLFNLCHLDISHTDSLREMPPGIGELTSLHTLSKVIVSGSGGMRLKSLGNLSHLQGEISIEELQNMMNVQEAKDARLIDKQNLDKISLAWSTKFSDSKDDGILQMDVLNALKPHKNLSSLVIKGYGGASLSNWIGDPTFSKLASIRFDGCRKCTNLPPLGQLPFLIELDISGMEQVKLIGDGFYGNRNHGKIPFPSLERLSFYDMPNWEEWLGLGNEAEGAIKLPRLRVLSIFLCPKLVRLPIFSLPSLQRLGVKYCPSLIEPFPQGNVPPNLTTLVIFKCGNLKSLGKWELHKLTSLRNFYYSSSDVDDDDDNDQHFVLPPSLTGLHLSHMPKLKTLPKGFQSLTSLRDLYIFKCPELDALPMEDQLSKLCKLHIMDCPLLKERCLKDRGDYWPIIANIPKVVIDGCDIHDD